MKAEFQAYLKDIAAIGPLTTRAELIYEIFDSIYPGKIQGIFMNDHIRTDGNVSYDDLWFFTDEYFLEAKTYLREMDFDACPNDVHYWNMKVQSYDFKVAKGVSRVSIDVTIKSGEICSFRAAKNNCDYLMKVFKTFISPRLV